MITNKLKAQPIIMVPKHSHSFRSSNALTAFWPFEPLWQIVPHKAPLPSCAPYLFH
jgi:hypothetical protein